jgi:hypothetical protein
VVGRRRGSAASSPGRRGPEVAGGGMAARGRGGGGGVRAGAQLCFTFAVSGALRMQPPPPRGPGLGGRGDVGPSPASGATRGAPSPNGTPTLPRTRGPGTGTRHRAGCHHPPPAAPFCPGGWLGGSSPNFLSALLRSGDMDSWRRVSGWGWGHE